jgi:GTP-binding protein LepA
VVTDVPAPSSGHSDNTKGLVFDFDYTSHRGIVAYTRIFAGQIQAEDNLELLAADRTFSSSEVGIFSPDPKAQDTLSAGSVGYVVTGIKEPGVVTIGDTLAKPDESTEKLAGYKPSQPVVWASVFPENQDDFKTLKNALKRLLLTDASLKFERERSAGLGQGYRCGFLGRLHMEVVIERLRRDYDLELITTQPSVAFRVYTDDREGQTIRTPAQFPHYSEIEQVEEPYVNATIRVPNDYINAVMTLVYEHEGEVINTKTGQAESLTVTAELPLRELMRGFFSGLKRSTSGFASLSYDVTEYRPAEVVRLEVLVADDLVPALSEIVSKNRLDTRAREIAEKLKELLPKQVVSVRIQTRAEGRIIASETVAATRKDVTEGLYGGDYSRKKKQLKDQREGKKKLREQMNVQIPSDVYVDMMRENS